MNMSSNRGRINKKLGSKNTLSPKAKLALNAAFFEFCCGLTPKKSPKPAMQQNCATKSQLGSPQT